MTQPNGPDQDSNTGAENWAEFDQAFEKVQQQCRDLQDRYGQVRRDLRMQAALRAEQADLSQQGFSPDALSQELQKIRQELDEIEVALESRLLSWESFREPFWQMVRFGGLGVLVGWLLKSWAG